MLMIIGEDGKKTGVKLVQKPETFEFSCPLDNAALDRMAELIIDGSSINCRMECPFRRIEG